MKLIISTTQNKLWSNLLDSVVKSITVVDVFVNNNELENNNIVVSQDMLASLDNIKVSIENKSVDLVLVFYQQCEYALVEGLETGLSLIESAEKWQRDMQDVLQLQKQNRRSVKLINLEQASRYPEEFKRQLAEIDLVPDI